MGRYLWQMLPCCGLTVFYVQNCESYKAFSKIASKNSGRFFYENYNLYFYNYNYYYDY